MAADMVHVGFKNFIAMNRVIAISSPNSVPIKRSVQAARDKGRLIDLSHGRRSKAVVFTDDGAIILTGIEAETIVSRANTG